MATTTSLFLASGKNQAQNGLINAGSREAANRPFGHQVKRSPNGWATPKRYSAYSIEAL